MFGKRISLFKVLGFDIRLDLSWIVIAVLITWSLAEGLFPLYYEDFARSTYWWMGVALGLNFLCLRIELEEGSFGYLPFAANLQEDDAIQRRA